MNAVASRGAGPSTVPDLVLAAGGTGGHIYPALAVGRLAQERGLRPALIGQAGGMEERLAADAGIRFEGVAAGKWHRGRPRPTQALAAAAGVVQAWGLVRAWRPRVVVGFGGFASFPAAFAAARSGVPLVLHEANAFPSQVNRWLAGRAALVISVHQEALAHLTGARRSTCIPYPVDERRLPVAAARAAYGIPENATVTLVMGGSQGSATLNREVPRAYASLTSAADSGQGARLPTEHFVLHSAGRGRAAEVSVGGAPGSSRYQVHDYLDAVTAWSAADIGITRAGSGTLASAAFHGVPLITVPLPTSAEDHQLHNAKASEAAGASVLVEERHIERLSSAWAALLEPDALARARAAAAARSPAGATAKILDAVMEVM